MAGNIEVQMIVEAISQGFDEVSTDLRKMGDSGEEAAKGLDKSSVASTALGTALGGLATDALTSAAGALADFAVGSIQAASDVEEMQGKFDIVFRDLAPVVTSNLEAMADATGRNRFELMGFAAGLQDTFVPMGFARDEAAAMSQQMTQLAIDLGSFNNIPTDQVVQDLTSAMVGNVETLQKYGVALNQARIDNKALEMGLDFTKGAMDAQTKAAVILQLTLEGTADAQGDAERTSESFANQQRALEAAMLDLQVTIGEKLLPTMTDLVGVAKELADGLNTITGVMGNFGDEVDKISQQNTELTDSFEDAEAVMKRTADQINLLGGFAGALTGTEKELNDALLESIRVMATQSDTANDFTQSVNENVNGVAALKLALLGLGSNEALRAFFDLQREIEATNQATGAWTARVSHSTGIVEEFTEAIEGTAREVPELTDKLAQQAAQLTENETAVSIANQGLEDLTMTQTGLINTTDGLTTSVDIFTGALPEATAEQDNFNNALFEAAREAGASSEQLAILAGGLGLYSDEAINAALQTALIQAEIDSLTVAYLNNDLTLEQVQSRLGNFVESLTGTGEAIGNTTGATRTYIEALNDIPDSINTIVDIQIPQIPGGFSGGGFQQDPDQQTLPGGGAGDGFSGGGDFGGGSGGFQIPGGQFGLDMIVPPGFPGDSFPILASSGERVTITPQNRAGQTAGSPTVNVNLMMDNGNMNNPRFVGDQIGGAMAQFLAPRG